MQRVKQGGHRLIVAMVLAIIVGTVAGYWARLHAAYQYGSETHPGFEAFRRLQGWLHSQPPPDWAGISFMGGGFLLTALLMAMRLRFIWWPFHPAGFAISGSWSMGVFWFSLFVSWTVKYTMLRFGGLRVYRSAVPFFLGFILGSFVVGSLWSLLGIVLERPMYRFLH